MVTTFCVLCLGTRRRLTSYPRNFENGESETLSWLDNEAYNFPSQDEPFQLPSRATFFTVGNNEDILLAVAYRSHPVSIWSPLDMQMLGRCGTAGLNGVTSMVFNPNPEIPALVVSFAPGDLCLYDYRTMDLTHLIPNVFADCVSCAWDGRALVTGSSHGVIQVFEFDMGYDGNMLLSPIYRVKAATEAVRGVTFSFDALRFVDITRRQCRIWEPAALMRKDNELESMSEAIPFSQPAISTVDVPKLALITSRPVATQDGRFIIAGRKDGTVAVFSAQDGTEVCEACTHGTGASVTAILFADQESLIVSASDAARVLAVKIPDACMQTLGSTTDRPKESTDGKVVLDRRFGAAVTNLKVNAQADRLLVSGHDIDELWTLSSSHTVGTRHLKARRGSEGLGISNDTQAKPTSASLTKSVIQHPTEVSLFIIIIGNNAHVFRWEDFSAQTSPDGILLQRPEPYHYGSGSTTTYHQGASNTILEHTSPTPSQPGRLITWPATAFDPLSTLVGLPARDATLDTIGGVVSSVIGVLGDSKLLFIDANLWICSTDLKTHSQTLGIENTSRRVSLARSPSPLRSGSPSSRQSNVGITTQRHFFALSEWQDRQKRLSCTILPNVGRMGRTSTMRGRGGASFGFVFGHRIIIVEGGMEFSEIITTSDVVNKRADSTSTDVTITKSYSPLLKGTSGDQPWTVVAGSMHRRASNW